MGIIRGGALQATESVQDLTKVSFRWLTVTLDESFHGANGFRDIRGISDFSTRGNVLKMRVSGDADLNQLVRHAGQYNIQDLELERPSLEETFLAFYGEK